MYGFAESWSSMKKYYDSFSAIFLSNCDSTKTVLVCGDHLCVNKSEAEQYFEDNLSLEVRIVDKKENSNLVELNLEYSGWEKESFNL